MVDREEVRELKYSFTENGFVLIVAFEGFFDSKTLSVLERCQAEIAQTSAKGVILNLEHIKNIDLSSTPFFYKFQVSIRKKPALLRLCSLAPAIEKSLTDHGSLRQEEVDKNLADSVRELSKLTKK